MAIYRFSAKVLSAGHGVSAVTAAAYRHAARMTSDRTGLTRDYSYKGSELVHEEITLPADAPEWARARYLSGAVVEASSLLWNDIEARELKSTRWQQSRYARSLTVSIPVEFTPEQRVEVMRDFVEKSFAARGMIADWVIHDLPGNPHAHVMLTMRDLEPDGWGKVNRSWNARGLLATWRFEWAAEANAALERVGHDVRIDHRRLEEQGLELQPVSYNLWVAEHADAAGQRARERERNLAVRAANEAYLLANPEHILAVVSVSKSVFRAEDVEAALRKRVAAMPSAAFEDLLGRAMASRDLVQVGVDPVRGVPLHATRAQVALDARMVVDAVRLSGEVLRGLPSEPPALPERLSDEQAAAVAAMLSPSRLTLVTGQAGAGKTTAIGAAAEAWRARGFEVLGGAVSGKAAQELAGAAKGLEVASLAAWEARWKLGLAPRAGRFVFFMDEAGMVGSDLWVRVQAQVDRMGGKLVAVGDADQLQPVSAGSAFKAIQDQVGSALIGIVRRQRDPLDRAATMGLATDARGAAEAIAHYDRAGAIAWSESVAGSINALAEAYFASGKAEARRIAMAHSNVAVEQLNRAIRAVALREGRLEAAAEVVYGPVNGGSLAPLALAPGDRVRFTAPHRATGTSRSAFGTVVALSEAAIEIRIDGSRTSVTLDAREPLPLEHGYAATIHKAQGMTVDEAFLLASPAMNRHLFYVGLSRHRERVRIFVPGDRFEDIASLARAAGRTGYMPLAVDADRALSADRLPSSARGLGEALSEAGLEGRPDLLSPAATLAVGRIADPHLASIASRMAGLLAAEAPSGSEAPVLLEDPRGYAEDPRRAVGDILDRRAVLRAEDVAERLAGITSDPDTFLRLFAEAMADPRLVALAEESPDGRGRVYTTIEHVVAEARLSDTAGRLALTDVAAPIRVPDPDRLALAAPGGGRFTLSADQRAAYAHILAPSRLAVITGLAGSGKSTLLRAVRDAVVPQGWRVLGTALAGKAADSLRSASGLEARTLAGLEAEIARAAERGESFLDPRTLLVIDEAGMVGTAQMSRVLEAAEAAGAKVVLVGDERQLQPLEPGAPFRAIAERVGTVTLTSVWRQRDPGDRAATLDLWTGGEAVASALRHYQAKGAITAVPGRSDALEALVGAYMADPAQDKIALAHSNADVAAINARVAELRHAAIRDEIARRTAARAAAEANLARARDEAARRGLPPSWVRDLPAEPPLPAAPLSYTRPDGGSLALAEGDQVIFESNDRALGVMNGTLGRVVALAAGEVTIAVGSGDDARLVCVDPATFPGLRHGFATTVHKSQGMSAASVHLHVTPGFDHAMAFVGMTRHTDRLSLYVPRSPEGALPYLERVLARVDAAPAALDHSTDPGRALAAAFRTLPDRQAEGPRFVTTSARARLERFADRHARAGARRWERSPAPRADLLESFRRALASTFRPVNEHDWLARKDAALLRRGFRAGLALSAAPVQRGTDGKNPEPERLALPERRQGPRLEIRAALAAAWARISPTPLDAATRDRLWRLADDLASPSGWREALRDVPASLRRALLSDADELADRMVRPDPRTGERRPDPALRMLTRAWVLAHATGRRDDEAVLCFTLTERGATLSTELQRHDRAVSLARDLDAMEHDRTSQTPEKIASSILNRLSLFARAEAVADREKFRDGLLRSRQAGFSGRHVALSQASALFRKLGIDRGVQFVGREKEAPSDFVDADRLPRGVGERILDNLPVYLRDPDLVLADRISRPSVWYVVTPVRRDDGSEVVIRIRRPDEARGEALNGPMLADVVPYSPKSYIEGPLERSLVYARDPAAVIFHGLMAADQQLPKEVETLQSVGVIAEARRDGRSEGVMEGELRSMPSTPSRVRTQMAKDSLEARLQRARLLDRSLGINRAPNEDLLSAKAVQDRERAFQESAERRARANEAEQKMFEQQSKIEKPTLVRGKDRDRGGIEW